VRLEICVEIDSCYRLFRKKFSLAGLGSFLEEAAIKRQLVLISEKMNIVFSFWRTFSQHRFYSTT